MATFLDVTALESFSVIFVFLFVWLVVYAVLLYTKVFGQNQLINVLIGLIVAFFVILSDIATTVVRDVAPIFAVVLVFVAIITVVSKMFGTGALTSYTPALKGVVIVLLAVALIVGSLTVVRQNIDVPERGEDFSKTSTIIFHPNFLGLVLLFLVAIFTVGLLAVRQT